MRCIGDRNGISSAAMMRVGEIAFAVWEVELRSSGQLGRTVGKWDLARPDHWVPGYGHNATAKCDVQLHNA